MSAKHAFNINLSTTLPFFNKYSLQKQSSPLKYPAKMKVTALVGFVLATVAVASSIPDAELAKRK